MKKSLLITGIVLLTILLSLIILPYAFKGKIIELVKNEANKILNAKMDFETLNLSFIKNFPDATIDLKNFHITGIDDFENDTLIYAKAFSATVNIKSFFGDSGYEILKVNLDEGKVHAITRENGKVNWDIIKSDADKEKNEESNASSDFKINLKKVNINHSDIFYNDEISKMNASIKDLNLSLSGDLSADQTHIKTQLNIGELNFIMDKITYLSQAKANAEINIDADLKNMKFILSDNLIQLNEIKTSIDGWVALTENEAINMDIKLNAPKTQFKDILSMVPAIYSKDFQNIKTSGEVTLDASAKGLMQGDTLPAFDIKLDIANAMFQYPSLPKSVNNININTHITGPGGSADNTLVDISKFHFDMAGNPFDITLHLSTPVSDPKFAASATGHLNLGMIKDVYPLENMELSGKLDADLKINSRMSFIEKEQYENIDATGNLNISDMIIKSEGMDNILLNKVSLLFSPQYVNLNDLTAQIGKNDIEANGKLENFIPFALKNETLKGTLNVKSNYLNLNDFMSEEETSSSQQDSSSISVIEIPKNIDFILSGNFKKVIFDNLNMENVIGQITINNGKVEMKNLNMHALGGSLKVNGTYDTSQNPKQPDLSLAVDINNASFAQTFSTFVTVQKFAPIFESIAGNFSTSLNLSTSLGSDFMPILTNLNANGLLQSKDVEVENISVLNALASSLKNDNLKELKIKDLKLPFTISEGRVTTNPFDINLGGNNKMNLSGSTGLDQTINYVAKIDLADQITKGYIQSVNVKIGGTFNDPKISLDAKDLAGQALNTIAGSILGGNDSTTVSQKINSEIDKQADQIRKQAQETGEKLIAEAEKQGENLIKEANKTKNPIAKVAAVETAKIAAKKLKEEAEKQAKKLNEEAEKQISSLTNQLQQ